MSTKIQWAEATWNPVVGCTPVSPGCLNCYAAAMAPRLAAMGQAQYVGLTVRRGENDLEAGGGRGRDVFNGVVRCLEDRLDVPLRKRAPTVWFVNSMSDLFHDDVPDEFLDRVFAVMALSPQHTFVVLTKRPERAEKYLGAADRDRAIDGAVIAWHYEQGPGYRLSNRLPIHPLRVASNLRVRGVPSEYCWPLKNVWIGASVEDQARADERVPVVCRIASLGWRTCLSVEPLIGPVDLTSGLDEPNAGDMDAAVREIQNALDAGAVGASTLTIRSAIDLVIVGGESGKGARACDVAWVRGVVGQCDRAGVACYVKQLGSRAWRAVPEHMADGHPCACGGCDGRGNEPIDLRHPKGGDPAEWPEDLRGRACVPAMWGGASREEKKGKK